MFKDLKICSKGYFVKKYMVFELKGQVVEYYGLHAYVRRGNGLTAYVENTNRAAQCLAAMMTTDELKKLRSDYRGEIPTLTDLLSVIMTSALKSDLSGRNCLYHYFDSDTRLHCYYYRDYQMLRGCMQDIIKNVTNMLEPFDFHVDIEIQYIHPRQRDEEMIKSEENWWNSLMSGKPAIFDD